MARIGGEEIPLATLTEAVKRRLALLPAGTEPPRKLVVGVARSALELLIGASLIMQEARRRFAEPARLDAALAEADGNWADEVPRLSGMARAADERGLRAKLARRAVSLDDLREANRLRNLAERMMRSEGFASLEAYLVELRRRTPVASILGSGPNGPPPVERAAELAGAARVGR